MYPYIVANIARCARLFGGYKFPAQIGYGFQKRERPCRHHRTFLAFDCANHLSHCVFEAHINNDVKINVL